MCLIDTQLTAGEVLRTFHHDEPYLFLGAAITSVGLVSIAFCVMRRRLDALLISMGVFAILYGQRLWIQTGLLTLTLPHNEFFNRLRSAIDYLIPIPGFIFFQLAGFLGRGGKIIAVGPSILFLLLVVGTFALGPLPVFHDINNFLVICIMFAMLATSLRNRPGDRDFAVVRVGLISFVVLALWDNMVRASWITYRVEPFGFAVLLACLGYVAARQTLERDQQYGEIQKELDLARRIQLSILPEAFPDSANFKVAARYVPMTSVAGDLYDFLVADSQRAGLFIADVSGHGVPAALIASMVKMAATSQRANAADPASLLTGMNTALCGNTQKQFVTAAYVHLDARAGELRYAAAGHPPMLLLRDGHVSEIIENGFILAVTELAAFTTHTEPLVPGDRLMLYTDGLLEARNGEGTLFGESSLHTALQSTAGMSPADAADHIIATVQSYARLQDDDLTLLVCDYQQA